MVTGRPSDAAMPPPEVGDGDAAMDGPTDATSDPGEAHAKPPRSSPHNTWLLAPIAGTAALAVISQWAGPGAVVRAATVLVGAVLVAAVAALEHGRKRAALITSTVVVVSATLVVTAFPSVKRALDKAAQPAKSHAAKSSAHTATSATAARSDAPLHLPGAVVSDQELRASNLRGANLTGASLDGADLHALTLNGAALAGASLRGANLRGADLEAANLTSTDLTGADLTGACLRGTNLSYAQLTGATFTAADLTDAQLPRGLSAPKLHAFPGTTSSPTCRR